MSRPPPGSTRTDTRFPYTPRFRSVVRRGGDLGCNRHREAAAGVDEQHLLLQPHRERLRRREARTHLGDIELPPRGTGGGRGERHEADLPRHGGAQPAPQLPYGTQPPVLACRWRRRVGQRRRSEEHTSELQSLSSLSYAGYRLKKKTSILKKTQ